MNKRSTILAGAVAAALGTTLSGCVGGLFSSACSGNCNIGKSIASETKTGPNGTWVNAGAMEYKGKLGFGVSAGQNVFVRFDLSSGAKFGTPSGGGGPIVLETYVGTSAFSQPSTPLTGTLVSGGDGSSYAIFELTAPSSGNGLTPDTQFALIPYFTVSPLGAGWAPSATAGITVQRTSGNYTVHYAEYGTASDAVAQTDSISSDQAPLLHFAQTLTAQGKAGTPGVIDVKSNDTLFTGSAKVAPIGELAIGDFTSRQAATASSPSGVTLNLHSGLIPIVGTNSKSTTLTVSGDFSAAPTTTKGGLDPAAVFIDQDSNSCSGPKVASAVSLTATQATFDLGNQALGSFNASSATGYATLCYGVSGKAPIKFGVTYTGSYAPTAATGYTLEKSYPLTLATLTSNGAHAQVLNIPTGATSGDQPYIRIYNTSSIAGPIRGTLYGQDGKVLYNGVLVNSLAPGAVQVLTAQDLQALAGTSWTGRARLDVFGQIPSMDVQGLVRTANGTLVNLSAKTEN